MGNQQRPTLYATESQRTEAIQRGVRTLIPATVVSYDDTTQRASVKPDRMIGFSEDRVEDQDVIDDLPVKFMRMGSFIIKAPLAVGDDVFIMVSDRSIAAWKEGRKNVNPYTDNPGLLFQLQDAVVIHGFATDIKPMPSFNGIYIGDLLGSTALTVESGAAPLQPSVGVARTGDSVEVTDASLAAWIAAVHTFLVGLGFVFPPPFGPNAPTPPFSGTITGGSSTIKATP